MSNIKNRTEGKSYNSLHSSFILSRSNFSSVDKQQDTSSKLSQFYTKATSEFEYPENNNQEQKIIQYQNRIKNLQSGYERSKEQYENSIKNMYKEKIILLNIISHNQSLVNQFRAKLKIQTSSFKEIETKYNIITSGLFHHQLCSNCIYNISNADFQSKNTEKEKQALKIAETNEKNKKKRLGFAKQYSWMYTPAAQNSVVNKLKTDIFKLKHNIEEISQEHSRKINEKNREIQHLRAQVMKLSKEIASPTHKIIICGSAKEEKSPPQNSEKQLQKAKEKIKHLEEELNCTQNTKEKYEVLFKEANQKLILTELERLNSKYRNKFF